MEISSWLSTIAALGALIAAVFAALTSTRLLQVERQRDLAAADERLRAGASTVIAWSAVHFEGPDRRPDGIVIRNGDTTPIFDLVVSSVKKGVPGHPLRMALLPPGEYFVAENAQQYHWDYARATRLVRGILGPVTKHATWRVTEMLFTDAAGRRWRRDDRGRLEAVAP